MAINAKLMLVVSLLWVGLMPVASTEHYPHMARKFWERAVCDEYILPKNAVWTPRTTCEQSKQFQCQQGYQSQVQITCKDGLWYQEPTCKAVECPSGETITNSDNVTPIGTFNGVDFMFNCRNGYTRNGTTGLATCDQDGNWNIKTACEDCYKRTEETIVNYSIDIGVEVGSETECKNECDDNDECQVHLLYPGNFCRLWGLPLIFVSAGTDLTQCFEKCSDMRDCLLLSYWPIHAYNDEILSEVCFLFNSTQNMLTDYNVLNIANNGYIVAENFCSN